VLTAIDVEERTATVDLGGILGVLDADANTRLARVRKRAADRNTWVQASRKDVKEFVAQLEPFVGRTVLVSIREVLEDGTPVLDWELSPELQGGVMVLEGGAIRGMVGGTSNSDFNRATMARRQLGSTWKPLLIEAALQLRWSSTDALDNRRAVFPYQATFYYPRPDHRGAPERVSIAWAMTKSENVASIWLMYHLTDRLNPEQFRQVAALVGLVPGEGDWTKTVQTAGVLPTAAKLEEGLFEQVRADVVVDLAFDGRDAEADALEAMHYGLRFRDKFDEIGADSGLPKRERSARRWALSRSLLRQEALAARFGDVRETILERVAAGRPVDEFDLAGLSVEQVDGAEARLSYGDLVPDGFEGLTVERFAQFVSGDRGPEPEGFGDDDDSAGGDESSEGAQEAGRDPERSEAGEDSTDRLRGFDVVRLLAPDRVVLEGQLSPSLVSELRVGIEAARAALGPEVDLYSFDMLALCRDFRTWWGCGTWSGWRAAAGFVRPSIRCCRCPWAARTSRCWRRRRSTR
jgi:hypothetical protein